MPPPYPWRQADAQNGWALWPTYRTIFGEYGDCHGGRSKVGAEKLVRLWLRSNCTSKSERAFSKAAEPNPGAACSNSPKTGICPISKLLGCGFGSEPPAARALIRSLAYTEASESLPSKPTVTFGGPIARTAAATPSYCSSVRRLQAFFLISSFRSVSRRAAFSCAVAVSFAILAICNSRASSTFLWSGVASQSPPTSRLLRQ